MDIATLTARELIDQLRRCPPNLPVIALEPGCGQPRERAIDGVTWEPGKTVVHLGLWREPADVG